MGDKNISEKEIRMKEIMKKIGHILFHEWDPIDVNDIPGHPGDEYDCYSEEVYVLLATKPSPEKIARYLNSLARKQWAGYLSVPRDIKPDLPVAKSLLSLVVNFPDDKKLIENLKKEIKRKKIAARRSGKEFLAVINSGKKK